MNKENDELITLSTGIVPDANELSLDDLDGVSGGLCQIHVTCEKLKCIQNGTTPEG